MAQLRTAARHVLLITAAHCAVLLALGSGVLMPPEQTSLLPPSFCVAPPEIYRTVSMLNFFFAPSAIGAFALAGVVASHHQAAAPGAAAATKAMLRTLMVTAIILSATSAGIAMAASFNILQAKAGRISCMSASVRASVYASYLLVGPILLLCYLDLARMALLSE